MQRVQLEVGPFVRSAPDRTREHRRDGNFAVRLGLTEVQGIGRELAERIVVERRKARFIDINDVVRRAGLTVPQAEALATAGAFDCFGLSSPSGALERRVRRQRPDTLPGLGDRCRPARPCRG